MAKNNNLGDFLKSLANKFRSVIGTSDKINPQDFESKVDVVFDTGAGIGYSQGYLAGESAGKQAEYDKFWDNYQQNGNRTNYIYAFAYGGWNAETFKPKYDLTVTLGYCENMFVYANIAGSLKTILNDCGVKLTFFQQAGREYGARYVFVGTKFTEIPELDCSQAKGDQAIASLFSDSKLIQTIEKLIMPTDCTGYGNYTFYNCRALQNINFEGTIKYSLSFADCPLSADSMQELFNHLDTNSAADARTITIKQIVKDNYIAKYTEEYWNNNVTLYTGPIAGWSFVII